MGPEKAFTVHSRGVFTQDKSGYFSKGKKWDREKMFTIKRCSLISGVRYERFHCIYFLEMDIQQYLYNDNEMNYIIRLKYRRRSVDLLCIIDKIGS